jgi:hypothetical protein
MASYTCGSDSYDWSVGRTDSSQSAARSGNGDTIYNTFSVYAEADARNRFLRAFTSFDTSDLPDDATILSATFKVKIKSSTSDTGAVLVSAGSYLAGNINAYQNAGDIPLSKKNAYTAIADIWWEFPFYPEHLNEISTTGRTYLGLKDFIFDWAARDDNDTDRNLQFYDYDDSGNEPILEITYEDVDYENDWDYEADVTITNNDNSNAIDTFQVKIELDSTFPYNDADADGDDIRFVSTDYSKNYSYHIREWNDSGDSTIYIYIDDTVSASGTLSLKMLWGNNSASAISNSVNTYYDYFNPDDFSTGELNNWTKEFMKYFSGTVGTYPEIIADPHGAGRGNILK